MLLFGTSHNLEALKPGHIAESQDMKVFLEPKALVVFLKYPCLDAIEVINLLFGYSSAMTS